MSEFEKWVDFRPAYDCIRVQPCVHGSERCVPGGGGNHGIHDVDMTMFLKGVLGAVELRISTGWFLDSTPKISRSSEYYPSPSWLGYHSLTPMYDGQEDYSMPCTLTGTGHCFPDGSGLHADEPFRILREKGSDAVWEFLEGYYNELWVDIEETA